MRIMKALLAISTLLAIGNTYILLQLVDNKACFLQDELPPQGKPITKKHVDRSPK